MASPLVRKYCSAAWSARGRRPAKARSPAPAAGRARDASAMARVRAVARRVAPPARIPAALGKPVSAGIARGLRRGKQAAHRNRLIHARTVKLTRAPTLARRSPARRADGLEPFHTVFQDAAEREKMRLHEAQRAMAHCSAQAHDCRKDLVHRLDEALQGSRARWGSDSKSARVRHAEVTQHHRELRERCERSRACDADVDGQADAVAREFAVPGRRGPPGRSRTGSRRVRSRR